MEFKILFSILYLLFLPQAGKIWAKSNDRKCTKFGSFWQKKNPVYNYYVYYFWNIASSILKEILHVKQSMMLKSFIMRLPFFIIPKITVVWHLKLSLEFRIKCKRSPMSFSREYYPRQINLCLTFAWPLITCMYYTVQGFFWCFDQILPTYLLRLLKYIFKRIS